MCQCVRISRTHSNTHNQSYTNDNWSEQPVSTYMWEIMSNMKKPPLNWVVNATTTSLVLLLLQLIPYGNGDSSFGTFSNVGSVGIFVHGTNSANTAIGGSGGTSSIDQKCPRVCTCTGQTVDCSHRDLQQVPRRIPLDAERL